MTYDVPDPPERRVLRWWPLIAFAVAWVASGIGAFYSVKSDLATAQIRMANIERSLELHEARQVREREELLREIRDLRGDIQRLMEQQRSFLRDIR